MVINHLLNGMILQVIKALFQGGYVRGGGSLERLLGICFPWLFQENLKKVRKEDDPAI